MSRLHLTFASCRYDRLEAIRDGEVAVEGIDLTCITLKSGRAVFDRMVGGGEFDVAELSASEYTSLHGAGDRRFVALPVFPSRVFRHGYIFINTRAGIRRPEDLAGRRIGVPLYTQTAAIWARGHLQHQFGVDLSKVRWLQGAVEKAGTHGRPHAPPLLRPVAIEQNHSGAPLSELLARGEIDALIAQAGLARPPWQCGAPVPRPPGARAEAFRDRQDLSDHASDRDPSRALRAAPLDCDESLRGLHRVQAPRACQSR